jgi:quercetin dioxygenase-like cupin family protein
MLEKKYDFKASEEKMIEKIVDDDNLVINHMVLTKDTEVPPHFTNSNVYLVIIKGRMSLVLGDGEPAGYEKGNIVNVPFKVKMNIRNQSDEILEFFVVKAPNPRDMAN